MKSYLENLKSNREFILIAEFGALIHDIGKLDKRWPKTENGEYDHTKKILDIDFCNDDLRILLNSKNCLKQLYNEVNRANFSSINHFISLHGDKNGKGPLRQLIHLADLWSSTEDRNIEENKANEEMKQVGSHYFGSNSFGFEININKKQLDFYYSLLKSVLSSDRTLFFSDKCCFTVSNRSKVLEILKNSKIIAFDYRPLNDVLLYDHSISTSAIFKVLLNQWINGKKVESRVPFPGKLSEEVAVLSLLFDLGRLFAQVDKIGDLHGRLSALQKIQDLLQQTLEVEYAAGNEIYREPGFSCFLLPVQFAEGEGEKELKSLLDSLLKKYCLNENLIIPYQFMTSKTQRIFGTIPRILKEFRGQILPSNAWHPVYISEIWNDKQQQAEGCPLCGMFPVEKLSGKPRGKNLCKPCDRLRKAGQVKRRMGEGTIWVDEIADPETNRIAVLCIEIPLERWLEEKGMLQLHQFRLKDGTNKTKTLSYERIRRLWTSTEEFINQFTEKVEKMLGAEERLVLDLKIEIGAPPLVRGDFYLVNGPERAELYLDENDKWQTVTRIKRKSSWYEGCSLNICLDRPGTSWFNATIEKVEIQMYYPLAEVLRRKNAFILIVSAMDARKLALWAVSSFTEHFSKALGKLPLSIGIVYAPARFPLSLPLKGALVMQKYLREESNQLIDAEVTEEPAKTGRVIHLKLKIDGVSEDIVSFEIDSVLGNNDTGRMDKEDIYYLRLPVVKDEVTANCGTSEEITLWDENKYIPELSGSLKKGSLLKILTGKFDYEFLDSTARRFDLQLNEKGKRIQKGPGERPLNINHLMILDRIEEMIKNQANITDTKVRNTHALLLTKFEEWHLKDAPKYGGVWTVYKNFVEAVINREFKLSPDERNFLVKSILSGTFFDWFEIFYQIEKRKIRGER
ncbi:MAG: hypothetical protein GYA22_09905 [Bacteroidales bacterium]|nr:hypothetical protein [Bacteroidales bacterium]